MKALISTLEPRQAGYRVAEVVADGATFPVAETMFWTDFPSEYDPGLVALDQYWYDPATQVVNMLPQIVEQEVVRIDNVELIPSTQELY
jgi:hypothetical protein